MEYKKVRKLGEGEKGSVYLVSRGGVEYAMKTEPALSGHISSEQQREIDFSIHFGNKHPDMFMKLHKWYVRDDVLHKIYSKVDMTFDGKVKLSMKQYMSICMQLTYAFYILHKGGWIHNDLHPGNIGFCKVDKDEIVKCFDEKVQTHGVKLQLIDFGRALGKKFKLTSKEKKTLEAGKNDELFQALLMVATNMGKVWGDIYNKEGDGAYEKRMASFMKSPENKLLKSIAGDKDSRFLLSSFLYPGKFMTPVKSHLPDWMIIWMFSNAITTKKSHYYAFYTLFKTKIDDDS